MARNWYNTGRGSSLSLVGGQVYLYVTALDARKMDREYSGSCQIELKIKPSPDEIAIRKETIRQTRKVLLAALAELQRREQDNPDR